VREIDNWPTPVANDDNKTPEGHLAKKPGRTVVTSLNIVATRMWPTPRSEDSESAGNHPGASDSLTGVVGSLWSAPDVAERLTSARESITANGANTTDWQTPGSDSFRSRGEERKNEMGLDQQARWFTPSASEDAAGTVDGKMQQMLTHQAKHFHPSHQGPETPPHGDESSSSTPSLRRPSLDGMSSRTRSEVEALFRLSTRERTVVLGGWKNKKLWREREGVLTTEKSRSFTRPAFRRQLNPNFVEWLMNWRPKWTSLAPLAFASPGTASSPPPPPSPSAPSGDNWPTPDTQNSRGGQMRTEAKGKHAMSLHHVVGEWDAS